tara:strand:- start:3672 stop:6461 length:2790 start_codon:yes stop_codon:yes gene_type:complete
MRILFVMLLLLPCNVFASALDISALPNKIANKLQLEASNLISPPINKEKLDDLMRWLYRQDQFQDIRISSKNIGDKVIYKLFLEEIPKIKDIDIVGNESVDKDLLFNSSGLQTEDNYDPYRIRNAASRILEEMRKNSYLAAKVNVEINDIKDSRDKNLIMNIDAGPSYKISSIILITPNSQLKKDLQKITNDYLEETFTEETVLESQNEIKEFLIEKKYFSTKLMEPKYDFDASRGIVNISFKIEGPYRYELRFNGNKDISYRQLMRKLELKPGDRLGVNPAADLSERFTKIYKLEGYANVNIQHKSKDNAEDFIREIQFQVDEGRKVKIREYIIQGTIAIKPEQYVEWIKEFSGNLIAKNYYHEEQLNNGLKNLVTHMQNQGFLSFRLLTSRVNYNKKKNKVRIYIRIEEGPQSILKNVEFQGAKVFEKDSLKKVADLEEDRPLQLEKVESAVDKLINFYKSNGFLDVTIDSDHASFIQYYDKNKKADLNFIINEGDQIIVNNIIVNGNKMTKSSVIRKALSFRKGDILDSDKLKNSEASLRRLGIFNSVTIKHRKGTSAVRDIIVTVNERKPGLFSFGAGVSNELEFTVRGYSGIAYRNLFGTARAIQGRVQLNSNIKANEFIDYSVNASYLEPFLFNSQTKGKVNIVNSQSLISFGTTDLEAVESTSINFLLENDLNRFLKLTWKAWGIERNKKFEVDDETISEERNIAEIGPTLEFDFRDNPFVPKKGTYTRFNLDFSSPDIGSSKADDTDSNIKTVYFVKTNLQFNQYIPIWKNSNIIFAYSLRGGYLKNLGNKANSAVPQERLFFLGGVTTIRGFEINSIPDQEVLKGSDQFASAENESYSYLAKLELRIPFTDSLGTAIFYDGGGVRVHKRDLGDPYRDAIGFSLQYMTPIGAINLGYGHKLDRKRELGESSGEIFFSIGDF